MCIFECSRRIFCSARSLRLLIAAILLVSEAIAQNSENVIRVDTRLAAFEVLVEDARGNPVNGLRAEDFRVFEEGQQVTIDFFQPVHSPGRNRPMVVVFAVDVSGSMTSAEIEKLQSAIHGFIDRFADYESYFSVISFAMNVRTLQRFTNRPDVLKRSLGKLERDRDGLSTHAFDAADLAVRMIDRSSPKTLRGRAPKRAVVIISDGFPVGDVVAPSAVIDRANDSGTSIYSIIMPSYSPTQRDARPLMTLLEASGLMERTGGNSFYAIDGDLEQLFGRLAREISGSYAIAFYPNDKHSAGNSRRTVVIESTKGYRIKQNRTSYTLKE